MKLLSPGDVVFDGTGSVYRQGRVMAVVGTLVLGGIFGGAPFLWLYLGAPWPVWGLCGALAMLIVPMLVGDLAAKFRSTNWLLWIRNDGLWINLRSYQDQSACDEPSALLLEYAEIAHVRERIERYTTPSSDGGSTCYSLQSLEIELRHTETESLAAALKENRRREQPQRYYLGVGVRSRPSHFPVSLPQAQRIRVAWRGGVGNWVAPALSHALRELSKFVPVNELELQRREDWSELSKAEFDEQVRGLAESGATMDAVSMLVRRRGYSTTEARRLVDELITAGQA